MAIDRAGRTSSLDDLGWDATWAEAFAAHARAGRTPARVAAVHRETSVVRAPGQPDRAALVAGRFRREARAISDFPVVGDWVAIESGGAPPPGAVGAADAPTVVAAVLPRRSAFRRSVSDANRRSAGHRVDEQVIAANVDVAFIVAGLDRDFNLRRIERYLAVAWASGVTPVVVLNKADIAIDLEGRSAGVAAIAPGVPVVVVAALVGEHLADLGPFLVAGRTAAVLGSSGVGKSTLVNALLGEARQATADVRAADSRGRHTTTHRELFTLPGGALLIDTPGIRSLQVAGADDGVSQAFDEIADLAARCRFNDCRHDGEPGCAVAQAVTEGRLAVNRLASHHKLEREAARAALVADPRARAGQRRASNAVHKAVTAEMARKYGGER